MKRINRQIVASLLALLVSGSLAAAQSKVVPIVEMKLGALIGGIENGKFVDAPTTAAKLAERQNYRIFLPLGKFRKIELSKPAVADEICDDHYTFRSSGALTEALMKKGGVALGDGIGWNPQPRAAKPIDPKSAEFLKIVNDYLRAKKIRQPVAKLDQAFRVDLDGDGREEVVLAASRIVPYNSRRVIKTYDAFSLVLVRKTVGGKPLDIEVAGVFFPRLRTDYDDYRHEVSSVADLDGDGKMELVMYSEFYEGVSANVVKIVGKKAIGVENLGASCGV